MIEHWETVKGRRHKTRLLKNEKGKFGKDFHFILTKKKSPFSIVNQTFTFTFQKNKSLAT